LTVEVSHVFVVVVLPVRSLRIHDIDNSDYGEYKCVASNPLGTDQQVMYLYGMSSSFSVIQTPGGGVLQA